MAVTFSASRSRVEIDPLFSCRLCLSDCPLTQAITLAQCHCIYCRQCMMQYLQVLITDGYVLSITCPDGLCHKQGVLSTDEIRSLVTDEIFDKYKRLKFAREVELDPHRTFCPEVGCEAICHVCTSANDSNKFNIKPISCPSCGLEFCSVCKAKWHGSISCDEHMMTGRPEDEGIPFSSSENAQIKRCPLCHVPIERNDGCAQMMCRRCKHVFCWYCLASLDDDFFLRHYDRGPCKNKLGHSRASVMWHRTQVVGIFAGFSVLLIMATPFLLLAAPCILCCKCKFFKCCKETEPQDSLPSSM